MSISRYLSKLAEYLNSSGVVLPSGGGTGITAPGASGNVLTSDGAGNWTSAAAPASGDYKLIQTKTAAGGETALTFSSIPQTYKHLKLIGSGRCQGGASQIMRMTLNNDTADTYNTYMASMASTGFTPSTDSGTTGFNIGSLPGTDAVLTIVAGLIVDFPNYTSTAYMKHFNSQSDFTLGGSGFYSLRQYTGYLLQGTVAAISRIDLLTTGGVTFSANSIYSLYGING